MHNLDLILTLTGGFIAALILGYVTHRIGLSPIVGYLLAGIRVLARTGYVRELHELKSAGADDVYSGEGEVALAMTAAILNRLGATPEQIDRERHRVQENLFGASSTTNASSTTTAPSVVEV